MHPSTSPCITQSNDVRVDFDRFLVTTGDPTLAEITCGHHQLLPAVEQVSSQGIHGGCLQFVGLLLTDRL